MGQPGSKYTHSKANFRELDFKWPIIEDISQITLLFSITQSGGIKQSFTYCLLSDQSFEK